MTRCRDLIRMMLISRPRGEPARLPSKSATDLNSISSVNCTKFGRLIPRKSLKLLSPYHTYRVECTKFDFGWGFAPDLAGGAYSASPDLVAGLQVAYF